MSIASRPWPVAPRHLVALTLLLSFPDLSASAQEESPWAAEGELGASVFFGNTEQATVATRAATERADSAYEFGSQISFTYGEATDNDGNSFVSKRSWSLESSLDWRPFERLSPFFFGGLESSLQRRIDLRYDLGIGGKLTLQRDDLGRVDFSVALLAERTTFRKEAERDPETRARWSGRFRVERDLGGGQVTFSTVNFYRPTFRDINDFVVESETSVSFRLTQLVTLQVSLLDVYDSRSDNRGARSNNDGQFLFSVITSF